MTFLCALAASLVLMASAVAADAPSRSVHSQPSAILATKDVEVAVTTRGGHMAPVTFFRSSDRPVQPYSVSPWQDEAPLPMPAPVLVTLRGDFFCMPFGGNSAEVAGEKHPPHGEIVGELWEVVGTKQAGDVITLTMEIDTKVRKGRVIKELSLVDGQNAVYSRHTVNYIQGVVRIPEGFENVKTLEFAPGEVTFVSTTGKRVTAPFRHEFLATGTF